jgi:tryptophanase
MHQYELPMARKKCQNAEKMHFVIMEMKENYKECTMEKINEEIS